MKIVVTGGHHTPALALIGALRRKAQSSPVSPWASRGGKLKVQIFWLGHKYSMRSDEQPSAEYKTITGLRIPFYELKAGKVYRVWDPLMWFRIPFGFFQALFFLVKLRPNLIVSFGGYLAAPVVAAGWLLRIPSVTHEQTVVSGWANRAIGRFARKVFITWEESMRYFPESKTILTGNPIRKSVFAKVQSSKFRAQSLVQSSKLGTIYITGGKQGSHVINEAVEKALPELLKDFNVIHQCGAGDYKKFKIQNSKFKIGCGGRYIVKDYFGEEDIGGVYAAADFVVSRAGANTVYELAALGKPAILIPIPRSSHNEQQRNAAVLVKAGLALLLTQENLTATTLVARCKKMAKNLEDFRQAGRKAKGLVKLDAADRMANEIISPSAKKT